MQVPAPIKVKADPLTVQTDGVNEAKLTGRPELAVADSAAADVPRAWAPGDAKVMVCASNPPATSKLCGQSPAARKLASPAWRATTVQVPAATRVRVVPLTVQTAGVLDSKVTTSPDVALATSATGAAPRVWLPGETKVMD